MADAPRKDQAGEPDPKRALTPKQLAAAAKAESEAAERRRERIIRAVGALAVLLVVAGLLAVGLLSGRDNDSSTPGATPASPDANAALPSGVQADTFGYPAGNGWTAATADKLPTLQVWADFQCPACKQFEAIAGENLVSLANEGKMKLLMRPAIFLDSNLPQSNLSSQRATSAWGCAIDAGKATEYFQAVFAVQPETEGVGYTDQQLLDIGKSVGLAGAEYETFAKCVGENTYVGWAANSNQEFAQSGATGTPTTILNGKEISASKVADPDEFAKALAAATKK
ncbi:MAG: DsbA family protein [Candidatus Nanopelagicales bacterium]